MIKDDKDQDLLQKQGGNGFPYLIFMDAEGNRLTRYEGPRTVPGMEETLSKVQAYLAAKKKVDSGDKGAATELFLAEIDLGRLSYTQAQEKMKGVTLSKEQQEKAKPIFVNLEANEIMTAAGNGQDAAKVREAGAKLAEMRKAGKIPSNPQIGMGYWSILIGYAQGQKDVALFEEALGSLKKLVGPNPNPPAKAWLDAQDEALKKMKEAK